MKLAKLLPKLFEKHQDSLSLTKIKTLIFCDPGMDDALMLWQMLSSPQHEVLGIIAGAGNVPRTQTVANTLNIVELTQQFAVKVFQGCASPLGKSETEMLNGIAVYGEDGLGGIHLPPAQHSTLQAEQGVEFAVRTICEQPIMIISTGGLTDVYKVLSQLQDQHPDKLAHIIAITMMAGVINPSQEANAPIAEVRQSEFNILFDPIASKAVFEITAQHNIPILLAPLDLTHSLLCSQRDAVLFSQLQNPVANFFYQFLAQTPSHYKTRYGLGPDGTYRQPIHDLHASNCLLHPEQYRGEWNTLQVSNNPAQLGTLEITKHGEGNVFLLQFLYPLRKQFFKTLLQDLRHYNHLAFQLSYAEQPEIVVWDLDDTLWDCLKHYRVCINKTREHYQLPAWSQDQFNNFGYVNREHMFQHADMFADKAHEALNHFYRLFSQEVPQLAHATLFAETETILRTLKQREIKLIAWSNTEDAMVQYLIDHFKLRDYFDHVMGSGGVTTQWLDLKPNPYLFEQTLQKLNLAETPRHKIWFVGDSLSSDIQAAHNAGCVSVWFSKKALTITSTIKPHAFIQSLNQIEQLLSVAKRENTEVTMITNGYRQNGLFGQNQAQVSANSDVVPLSTDKNFSL